jgi:pilus assembly protein Flp/PilA
MEGMTMESIKRFFKEDSAIAATEYVVLAALITGGIVLAVTGVGNNLANFFNGMGNWIGSRSFGTGS